MKGIHLSQSFWKSALPQMLIERSGIPGDQRKPLLWHKLFYMFCKLVQELELEHLFQTCCYYKLLAMFLYH